MPEFFGFSGLTGDRATQDARQSYGRDLPIRSGVRADQSPVEHSAAGERAYVRGADLYRDDEITVLLIGSPRLMTADPTSQLDAADIARAFGSRREALFGELAGGFAIACLSNDGGEIHLAIDHLGIERIAFHCLEDGIVYSDSVEAIAGLPGAHCPIREQALFEYLFFHMIPAPGTIFDGVEKLRPGHYLHWRHGQTRICRYWDPQFDRDRSVDEQDLAEELHHCLEEAVRSCAPDTATGAFLSGGLDSSTVAGKLSRCTDDPAKSFSIGFDLAEYDELPYARIAAKHFGCEAYEYYVNAQDILSIIESVADFYDEPFGNSSAIPTFYCAKLASESGVSHLLAGDGGDELFAGNERYARQSVFDVYGKTPAWLRDYVVQPAVRRIDPESRITPLRKLRSYVDQARIPLPDRFESWNFVYREAMDSLFDDGFSQSIDLDGPLRLMRSIWGESSATGLLDRMLQYDWQLTLADNDLRKVRRMCDLNGVNVSFPMLDRSVVELSMRVPDRLKMRGLNLRSFYKRAMRGFLPDEILTKPKHGFGLPFGQWLKTNRDLADLVGSSLTDLKSRRVIKPAFIDQLIDAQQHGHASYYGYVIWDLVMLEQWLQKHASGFSA